jgi:quercetin dioxygenase-like cupin family protein
VSICFFKATEPGRSSAGSVTFEPGARTVWHTHPLGQAILITAGCGWVQREGGPIEEVHPGDSVWFDAGEKHWHGATPNSGMSHIAVTEWLDSKVAASTTCDTARPLPFPANQLTNIEPSLLWYPQVSSVQRSFAP